MSRFIKLTSRFIGILLAIYLVIMLLLVIFVKSKDFTPMVSKALSEKTGVTIPIEGRISLSIFPWPAVTANNLVIKNATAFKAPAKYSEFITIKRLSARIKVMQLFHGNIQLANIVIDHASINLITAKNGQTNWSALNSLFDSKATDKQELTPASPSPATTSTQFPVIYVTNSSAQIINLTTNKHTEVDNIELTSPASDDPLVRLVTLNAQIRHSDPALVLELRFSSKVAALPKQAAVELEKINFAATWEQVQHKLPKPVSLIMRGGAIIKKDQFKAHLHGNFDEGEGTINLQINKIGQRITHQLNIKNIYVAPIAQIITGKDWIDGYLNGEATLNSYGNDFDSQLNNLSGNGNLKITEGKLKGFNLDSLVANSIANMLSNKKASSNSKQNTDDTTEFTSISDSFIIKRGLLTTDDFLFDSRFLSATGKGQINIPMATLNARLLATYKQNQKWEVPIILKGSLFDPSIQPDTSGIAQKLLEKQFQKGLDKKLDNLKDQLKNLFN